MNKFILMITLLVLARCNTPNSPNKADNINYNVTSADLIGLWHPYSMSSTFCDSNGNVTRTAYNKILWSGDTLFNFIRFIADSIYNYSYVSGIDTTINGITYNGYYEYFNKYYSIYHSYWLDGFDSTLKNFQSLFSGQAGKCDSIAKIQIRDNNYLETYYQIYDTNNIGIRSSIIINNVYIKMNDSLIPAIWPFGPVIM
jgi:hypothetical protein